MKRILLIGVGPHARHFYLPALNRPLFVERARVVAAVDLENQEEAVRPALKRHAPIAELCLVQPLRDGKLLPGTVEQLDSLCQNRNVDGVIVSTDPLSHKAYALWAMHRALPLLLDKPVTTRVNARLDPAQAAAIWEDYQDLLAAHQALPTPRPPFLLCVHRRYHPAIQFALDAVREVSRQTGCPVTHLHGYHSDGQWRMPSEMITQAHHSYYDGHGKVSHSGYHFLDCIMSFWQAGLAGGFRADQLEVCSAFVTPPALLQQLPHGKYFALFGPEYAESCPHSDTELHDRFQAYGEIDADIQLSFLRNEEPVALGNLSLLHNGFSRRSWLRPGEDLYKGNGRVKHEQHRLHVGPFLSIQIHSCQAKDKHQHCDESDRELGGNNHLETWVFRNSDIIGGESVQRLGMQDIESAKDWQSDRLFIDRIKEGALLEFVEMLCGERTPQDTRSGFDSHALPVRLMSAIYQSAIHRHCGQNPLVRFPLEAAR